MTLPAAALAYTVITLAMFRALVPDMATHVSVYPGDPLLNAAIMGWNAQVMPLTEGWWHFPSFAPVQGVTSFTEHLLLSYPIASPIVWITGNPVLAYNVVLLSSFVLNGVAAYALAREVTSLPRAASRGSRAAAFIGGLAFAFAPYHAGQVTHVQMLMAWGIPLTLLGLHRSNLGIFALGWLATALSTAYMLAFVPVLVVLWCLWFVPPAAWKRLLAPLAIALLVVAALSPLLLGYASWHEQHGLVRQYDEIRLFAADLTDIARPSNEVETAIFPGIAIAALALIALVAGWRGAGRSGSPGEPAGVALRTIAFYFTGALVMWSLTLGPEPEWNGTPIAYGPYRLLMELPGFSSLRVPARAWLPAALCLAVLAACGAQALLERSARYARPLMLALALVIVAEGWFTEPTVAAPVMTIERGIPPGVTVLDLPVEESWWNAIPQYRAVLGGYRTVNGYSGFEPPHFQPLRRAIADLEVDALDRYRAVADLYVIVREGESARVAGWIATQPGADRLVVEQSAALYRLPRR